jgi:hypothetical protein
LKVVEIANRRACELSILTTTTATVIKIDNRKSVECSPLFGNSGLDEWNELNRTVGVNHEPAVMDYVVAFPENLVAIAALGLTPSEMKVLAHILKAMEWGNLLSFEQKACAEAVGLGKSAVSKIFRSLTAKGVIVRNDGHLYINSNLFAKGWGSKWTTTQERLAMAAKEINGIAPAFDTDRTSAGHAVVVAPPVTESASEPTAPPQRAAFNPQTKRVATGAPPYQRAPSAKRFRMPL